MMKVISVIVLICAMIWSWTQFNSKSTLSTQTHAELQSKLAILIEETLKTKKPNSSDFELKQMFTTAVNQQIVSAQFSYKYKDVLSAEEKESIEQIISGTAILEKAPTETGATQKWIVQSVKTNQESIEFSEGMVVTAGDTSTASETPAPENAPTSTTETKEIK